MQDLVHGFRLLVRQPSFGLTAVLTLALGIGANAAVFAVAWQVLLRPLPWPDADRIVQVWNTVRKTGQPNVLAPANYLDFEREARSFDAMAAYNAFPFALNLTGNGEPIELRVRTVLGDYFGVFATPARVGRTIGPDDFAAERQVVVLSEGMWRRQFGADPRIVGRAVTLDGEAFEVIGVMPSSFDPDARPVDGWIPFRLQPRHREQRLGYFLAAVGRLKPGVSLAQARSELDAIAARAGEAHPASNAHIGATARPIREELAGSIRGGVLMLAGAAGLVLLIAAANLTSLQLARTVGRERELAVRAALGASRGRLIRMLIGESLAMSVVAGIAGLFAGLWILRALTASAPPAMAAAATFALDPVVPAYTLLLAVLAGVLLAAVPAWRATRQEPARSLRSRGGADRGSRRIRTLLVVAEVALATMLLVSAAVLVVSMLRVLRINPGFDGSGVMAANVRLPPARYETIDARTLFFDQVFERLRAAPGVEAVCAANAVPFETQIRMTYVPEGSTTLVGARPLTVTEDCFRTMRVPLRRGRLFEHREAEPVAIVSEGFASRAFPGVDPIGRTIRVGLPTGDPLTITGIVGDMRLVSLEAPAFAQVYQLATQSIPFPPDTLLVRATTGPEDAAAAIQRAVREVDPAQPVADIRSLESVTARSLAPRRFNLALLGGFAAIALLLSAIGVYGLLAELVAQRRAEIGVRMALGATAGAIVRLVSAGALGGVAAGIGTGLAGAWMFSRILQRFAYEVSTTSPAIYGSVAALLATIALAAAYIPSRRAARIDPVGVLRE